MQRAPAFRNRKTRAVQTATMTRWVNSVSAQYLQGLHETQAVRSVEFITRCVERAAYP